MFLFSIFTTLFYQPLFNLLVATYDILALIPGVNPDMGVAVIIFTIIFRILWLPISFASDRSEKEKREISKTVEDIGIKYSNNPVKKRTEIKNLLRSKKGPVVASAVDLFFQILIALMLYRMFSTGLEGTDFNLLYKFIPQPDKPFNLVFLGIFDLSHTNTFLNLLQSLFILIAEVLAAWASPFPTNRNEMMTIIFLPVLSFFFFMFMPAGKKLFIITTLGFSITLMLVKQIIFVYHSLSDTVENFALKQAKLKT